MVARKIELIYNISMENKTIIKYYNDKPIRGIFDTESEKFYFAVIDVVSSIRDTKNARRYWADQKRRHPELAALSKQIKITARDNKNYMTEVMDEDSIKIFLKSIKCDCDHFSLCEKQEPKKELDVGSKFYHALQDFEIGTVYSLQEIHYYLFHKEDENAGQIRKVEASLGSFNYVPAQYLNSLLVNIDEMPIDTFDEIVQKYIELGIAHPFENGNGIALRIWLNHTLKYKLHKIVDWTLINKDEYCAIKRKAPIDSEPLFVLLHDALKDDIDNIELFKNGLNHLYTYEN